MNGRCEWNADAAETGSYTCQRCSQKTLHLHPSQRGSVQRECKNPPPPGPGTELMKMLHSFGIKPTSCAGECEAMRRQMDAWGEQCDQHLPEIVGHLRKAYKATSWASLTAASMAALTTGLAFQLDWTDPIPSLVKLAIARARRP